MSREIKFRGKRISENSNSVFPDWVYGHFVADPIGNHRIYWKPFEETSSNTYHFVHPESVGQFTGMLDGNGKEIYEGDFLKAPSGNLFEVFFCENNCGWRTKNNNGIYKINAPLYEIIGNIYENPELLNETN